MRAWRAPRGAGGGPWPGSASRASAEVLPPSHPHRPPRATDDRAQQRGSASRPPTPPPSVCVALSVFLFLFFLLRVGFFLEQFHRNSCNKDLVFSWCSDVAARGLTLLFSSPAPRARGPPAWPSRRARGAPGLGIPAAPLRWHLCRTAASPTCWRCPPSCLPGKVNRLLTGQGNASLLRELQPVTFLNKQKAAGITSRLELRGCVVSGFKGPTDIFQFKPLSLSLLPGFGELPPAPGSSLPKEEAGALFRQGGFQG